MRIRAATVLLAAVLCGCGGVVSTAPASDEATSRVDDRLLGFWRADYAASKSGKSGMAEAAHGDMILVVGRKPGSETALQLLGVTLSEDKTIKSDKIEFTATTINGKDYASAKNPPKEGTDSKQPSWFVVRYEMPDADTLRVVAMDEKAVAADVKAGKIAGSTEEWKAMPSSDPTLLVTLTASTTVLRAYLELHGDGAFANDQPLVLRRLRMR